MKYYIKLSITLVIFFPFLCLAQKTNDKLQEFSQNYFAIKTEGLTIDEIVNELKTKRRLMIDTLIQKNNNQPFYLRGYASNSAPFILPGKMEYQIREVKVKSALGIVRDSFLLLQLILIPIDTLNSKQLVTDELKKLHKKVSALFTNVEHQKSKKKSKSYFETYNYRSSQVQAIPQLRIGVGTYYRDPRIFNLILETYCFYNSN